MNAANTTSLAVETRGLSNVFVAHSGVVLVGGHGVYPLSLGFGVMTAVFLMLLALASRLYPGLVR